MTVVIISIPVVIILSIPISGIILNIYREDLHKYIRDTYKGYIHVGEIKGNLATGLVLEDVYFLPENENLSLPVWTGEKIIIKLKLLSLLAGHPRPSKIILDNFVFRIEQRKDGTFRLPPILPVQGNSQGGSYEPDDIGIVINDSKVIYEENADFISSPLMIEIGNVNASSFYRKNGKLSIGKLTGELLNSKISAKGYTHVKNSDESNIELQISDLGLWQLCDTLGRLFPTTEGCRPAGEGDFNLRITGSILNPSIDGSCYLDSLSIGNFHLEEMHLELNYKDKLLQLTDGVAKAYDGRIVLSGSIATNEKPAGFHLSTAVMNLDLGKYIREIDQRLDPVSGLFNGQFKAEGDFGDINMFKGDGFLECAKGMYMNPFRDHPNPQPRQYRSERMGFDVLEVEFNLENSKLLIDNFYLDSKYVDIESSGSIAFDGNLNIEGTLKAQSNLLKSSDEFSDIISFLPVKDIQIPVKFRLTGKPGNFQIQSALPEEMINSLLGEDYVRREAARQILQKYLGEGSSDLGSQIPSFSNGSGDSNSEND